ncbi:acyl carrier protein [Actinophytocola sediminis]
MTTNQAVDAAVATRISAYLEAKANTRIATDTDLADAGILTSMMAMEIVVFLETTFDIAIIGQDLKMTNFRTVDDMVALVTRLRETPTDG